MWCITWSTGSVSRGFRDADHGRGHCRGRRPDGRRATHRLPGWLRPHDDRTLSQHLASRAEVAQALTVVGGPELVWLGAAIIIGAGSTSFEMMRYVADRFPVIPTPAGWAIRSTRSRSVMCCTTWSRLRTSRGCPPAPTTSRAGHHVVPRAAQDVCACLGQAARDCAGTHSTRRWPRWCWHRVAGALGLAGALVDSLDHPMVAWSGACVTGARSARGLVGASRR